MKVSDLKVLLNGVPEDFEVFTASDETVELAQPAQGIGIFQVDKEHKILISKEDCEGEFPREFNPNVIAIY